MPVELTSETASSALLQVQAELCRQSLARFVTDSWAVVKPETPFVKGWHIDAICEHLEAVTKGEIRRLIISVPPDHSKSSIVAICWPAWVWTGTPSFDWLFSSYSSQRAIADSTSCRRIIESDWYRSRFGGNFYLTSDQNQKSRFENSVSGKRVTVSLMGAGTGEHADAVVCDDPHDIKDQFRPNRIQTAVQNWDQVMSHRINDPRTSRHVIIMQRIHHTDLVSHALKQGGYEYLMLASEYDPKRSKVTSIGWKDPRKRRGELLNPQRFGPEEIKDAKVRLGTRGFNAQHQQDPSAEEGMVFRRGWFRFYGIDPRELVQTVDEVIQSWDFALKDLDTSSKVAGHVWARKGADKFLLDRVCEHLDFVECIRVMIGMAERWPQATAKIVEDKANGPAVIATLRGKLTGLIPWPPKGRQMDSKIARATAMQPEMEAGNVWLPDPRTHPWVGEFIEYCVSFPGGEFDDDIDAMSQAFDRFRGSPILTEANPFSGETRKSYWKRI